MIARFLNHQQYVKLFTVAWVGASCHGAICIATKQVVRGGQIQEFKFEVTAVPSPETNSSLLKIDPLEKEIPIGNHDL